SFTEHEIPLTRSSRRAAGWPITGRRRALMAGFRTRDYDVIVVGARCAGATLATFLARAGADVLLLDKDAMPSEQVLSTHHIHAAGMEVLDELGVGRDVRSAVRASSVVRLDLNGFQVDAEPPAPAYCPRRARLDGLLQRTARAAGAVML